MGLGGLRRIGCLGKGMVGVDGCVGVVVVVVVLSFWEGME